MNWYGPVHSLAAVTIPLQKNSKQPDHTNSNKNNTKTTKLTKKTHQTKTKENTETKKSHERQPASCLAQCAPCTCDLPSSVCTAGPEPASCPAQSAPLDLNREAAHLVCTAGPQPGTCPAQCAPLDLNLRASQLSLHRWTSTGKLPI